jgi:hypothetical protein
MSWVYRQPAFAKIDITAEYDFGQVWFVIVNCFPSMV